MSIEKVMYRAHAKAIGGRDGRALSSDNVLDLKLTVPREMGGAGEVGTNPEQLFAAGYSACFLGALKYVAGQQKITLPATASIEGSVGIGQIPTGFGIEAELKISLPCLPREPVEARLRRKIMLDGVSLDQLEIFIAAAEQDNHAAAGRRLRRAQSVVSQTVANL